MRGNRLDRKRGKKVFHLFDFTDNFREKKNFCCLPLQLMLLSSNTYVEPGFKLAVRSRVVGLRAVVEVRHTREVQP